MSSNLFYIIGAIFLVGFVIWYFFSTETKFIKTRGRFEKDSE